MKEPATPQDKCWAIGLISLTVGVIIGGYWQRKKYLRQAKEGKEKNANKSH